MRPIGVIANPAAGKDIRRLSAGASVSGNREKTAILRRALVGALEAGATDFVYMDDPHRVAGAAFADCQVNAEPLPCIGPPCARHSADAAEQMRARQCAALLVLGGDGTARAAVSGWRDCVLLPLSTGTNNAFPVSVEATVAGAALGLIGRGAVRAEQVSRRAKIIDVEIEGEHPDLALIDAVLVTDAFIGAKALLDAGKFRLAVLTRADPASVGSCGLGGLLQPLADADDGGLSLAFGAGGRDYRAPLAPGRFGTVSVTGVEPLALGRRVVASGPGMLAFDGERERILAPDQTVAFSVTRTGPRVVDTAKVMRLAAKLKLFAAGPGCS